MWIPIVKALISIVFILDMTGSMAPLKDEAVIMFNDYLMEQQAQSADIDLTLITFNYCETKKVFDAIPVKEVPHMTSEQYQPDCWTPLLDTIGDALKEHGENPRTIFVILTDGKENASYRYSREQIFSMIDEKENMGWKFVFAGANQDSYAESSQIGIYASGGTNYFSLSAGITNFAVTTGMVEDCGVWIKAQSSGAIAVWADLDSGTTPDPAK